MLNWVKGYYGKDERFISFAGDILLQKGHLESAMALYTSVNYSDNYQEVMTAMKQQAEFGTVMDHFQW